MKTVNYYRKKKSTTKQKLWRIFSEYIRLRDSPNNVGSCISCGKLIPYPNSTGRWHAGHYYSRSTTWSHLYFDERNVNGQCRHCNTFLEGNKQGYQRGLMRKYGDDIIERLDIKRGLDQRKMHDYEYEELTKYYKGLIRTMKEERGLK